MAAFAQRYGLIIAWVVVVAFFGILSPDTYLTSSTFKVILGSQAVLLLLVVALLVPLTTGDFDLSVAATLALSSMLIAKLNVIEGWSLVPALLVGVAAGAAVGCLNGLLIVVLDIDSFIATLGTSTILTGLVQLISNFRTISGIDSGLTTWVTTNRLFGVSLSFYYATAACAVLWYVLEYTPVGRRLLFVGRGRNVSRLSGLRVERLRFGALVASGTISALAGVLYLGTAGGTDPSSGLSFLLPAFAAAYLGATAIKPGRFNAWGGFVAVYFLVSGITGLQILGADTWVQPLFYGGALVIAVDLSQLASRRRLREEAAAARR